jgi:hypothetical protein
VFRIFGRQRVDLGAEVGREVRISDDIFPA